MFLGKFKFFLIILIVLISFVSVWSLKVTYNTTHPYQFQGNDSFEDLNDVRINYRADPVSVTSEGTSNLVFIIENPTDKDHLVSIVLFDVPSVFRILEPGIEVERKVQSNSKEQVTFIFESIKDAKPRSYWYGFDIIDYTLGKDQSIVNTEKRLGTYGGLNIVERLEEEETIEKSRSPLLWILLIAVAILTGAIWLNKKVK